MKRWAILTVLLYAVALALLTLPVVLLAFGNWGKNSDSKGFHDTLELYQNWAYWIWLAVLMAGQALLLLLPIHIAEKRLPARRPLRTPVIVTAFFLANLCLAGLLAGLCAIFLENGFQILNVRGLIDGLTGALFQIQPGNDADFNWQTVLGGLIPLLVFWLVWAVIFRRATRADEPDALVKRITRWLLRGSILELIVAVPSHVIVRRRDDCCAPVGTFWGIATGISVMLLCFGPGVFFLFAERCRRLQPKPPAAENPPAEITV